MGLENYQLKHGCRNETPENTESYEKAIKQTRGNLKWSLKFLNPEEITEILAKVSYQNFRKKSSTPTEQYLYLDNFQIFSKELAKKSQKKKAKLISSCGSDLLKIKSFVIADILVVKVKLDQNDTMTHSSASQEFAKDNESNNPAINLFTEDYSWDELFCPDCYKKQRPERREVNGFIEFRCSDCGSGLCPEKLLDEAGEIIENQKEAGDADSSQQESGETSW